MAVILASSKSAQIEVFRHVPKTKKCQRIPENRSQPDIERLANGSKMTRRRLGPGDLAVMHNGGSAHFGESHLPGGDAGLDLSLDQRRLTGV
jgi:hypothetical protein